MTSNFDIVCPKCNTINPPTAASCQNCSHRFSTGPSAAAPSRRPANQRSSGAPPRILSLIKPVIIIVLLGLLTWGSVKIFSLISTSFKDLIPYPTDPAQTTTEFFSALALENYQACYNLLSSERKAATVINQQTQDAYFQQFDRIRVYLNDRAGENFADTIEVSPNGNVATFHNDIIIHLTLKPFTGSGKEMHYSIANFNNFPIDVAPAMGFEERNRMMDRIIDSGGDITEIPDTEDMNPEDIIRSFLSKSKSEQLNLLIESFLNQRQLDTRHTLLDSIIMEFPREPATRRFLTHVADNEAEIHQLRRTAQIALSR